ncbi:class I SAM-dependent methyltransferase [Photobacterium sanctipauli]|uniref:Class I SAM-dependent methyltransferase n=1 Tax=Photobacterium sanctipauli TaxID=1342794 RepID=A0A2T3P012_9GAMM|nr:class I SAM-dependent methyltransferase [Photobacterium sanctipauli]PSW21809.1 class I SAM-dependent methyltransferase [Photobacterium sanctipauli]
MNKWDDVAEEVNFNLQIAEKEFIDAVSSKAKILDFGCGYGRITHQLFQLGFYNVLGIDTSKEMIHRGLNQYPYLDLRYLPGSPLPFGDDEFDVVVTCAVFTCIPHSEARNKVLSELYRVLKSDGVLYLAEFCSDEGKTFISGVGVPMWHGAPSEIEQMLEGFKVTNSTVVENKTMTGHISKAIHLFARKV